MTRGVTKRGNPGQHFSSQAGSVPLKIEHADARQSRDRAVTSPPAWANLCTRLTKVGKEGLYGPISWDGLGAPIPCCRILGGRHAGLFSEGRSTGCQNDKGDGPAAPAVDTVTVDWRRYKTGEACFLVPCPPLDGEGGVNSEEMMRGVDAPRRGDQGGPVVIRCTGPRLEN